MPRIEKDFRIQTRADYRWALKRMVELRDSGATANNCEELATLEGAIAMYVSVPGQPAEKKGRPNDSGETM